MFEPLHAARVALVEAAALSLINESNAGNPAPVDELHSTIKNDGGVWLGDTQYIAGGVPVAGEAF